VLTGNTSQYSESLGISHSYVQSTCSPLNEDYTQIFYMIDKGDVPSIQCKMNLRGHKPTRKVDYLSLIFVDFYVPALVPHLNKSETSLQLSEEKPLFAVCRICIWLIYPSGSLCISRARTTQKTPLPPVPLSLRGDLLLRKFYTAPLPNSSNLFLLFW
jgi:hypothetical protein